MVSPHICPLSRSRQDQQAVSASAPFTGISLSGEAFQLRAQRTEYQGCCGWRGGRQPILPQTAGATADALAPGPPPDDIGPLC